MAAVLLQDLYISLTVGKSKCPYELSDISYFYDLQKPGVFVVPNRIFRDTGTQLFKLHKTRTNSIPNKDRVYRLKYIRILRNPNTQQCKPNGCV
jgi:hypothetical protein